MRESANASASPRAIPSQATDRAVRPLAGVRVIDFSRLLPGAYCTWLLASLGADVVKIEQPGKGDYQRDLGLRAGARGGAVYQLVNQGKRSLGLDLRNRSSTPVLKKLLAGAEIIVESFRPGVAKRLGVDFDALRAERPSLVCVSISGFGATSPLHAIAAHDINYLALSGALDRQLQSGGDIPELPIVDLIGGGLVPALSALSLLLRSKLTGIGGVADASLADAVPLLPNEILAAALLGQPEPDKSAAEFSGAAPNYAAYRLRDGYVAVGAVEDQFWAEFCRLMDLDAVAPRDNPALKQKIADRFMTMSRQEAEALFEGRDVCVTVVNSYGEMLKSAHARSRGYVAPPAGVGAAPRLGSPFFHDGRRLFCDGVAPLLGEHSELILRELGFGSAEIAALVASGAIEVASDAR